MLRFILEGIDTIQARIRAGRTAFLQDELLQDSVLRRLETVTDAAPRLSESLRGRHAGIEWKAIRGFRNRIAHGYLHVDMEIVWTVIEEDLPPLRAMVVTELERCAANEPADADGE